MENNRLKMTIVTGAVLAVSAVSLHFALQVHRQSDQTGDSLLGDEFYDPVFKLRFRPPRGWRRSEMEEDLQQQFSGRSVLHATLFQPFDGIARCMLVVFEDEQNLRLAALREKIQEQEAGVSREVLKDDFDYLNDLQVWVFETREQHGGLPIHRVRVWVDRGDRKVALFYEGAAGSMQRRADAVAESIQSLRLE